MSCAAKPVCGSCRWNPYRGTGASSSPATWSNCSCSRRSSLRSCFLISDNSLITFFLSSGIQHKPFTKERQRRSAALRGSGEVNPRTTAHTAAHTAAVRSEPGFRDSAGPTSPRSRKRPDSAGDVLGALKTGQLRAAGTASTQRPQKPRGRQMAEPRGHQQKHPNPPSSAPPLRAEGSDSNTWF